MKNLINYFFRGLLVVFPLGATIYLVVITMNWLNSFFGQLFLGWFDYQIPGMGIIIGFLAILVIGFLVTRTFSVPLVHMFEGLLRKIPIISIVYTSLKDLTEALVGERRKFTNPVCVRMSGGEMIRFGFVTQYSLNTLNLENHVAVYCPHSFNISGNLYIVPREWVTPMNMDSAEFMRFIISGGIARIDNAAAVSDG